MPSRRPPNSLGVGGQERSALPLPTLLMSRSLAGQLIRHTRKIRRKHIHAPEDRHGVCSRPTQPPPLHFSAFPSGDSSESNFLFFFLKRFESMLPKELLDVSPGRA